MTDGSGVSIVDEVLESIADERPLKETFDLIAEVISRLGAFDFCGILLLDKDGSRIHLAGAFNFPARYEELLDGIFRVPYRDASFLASPTSRALREGRTVVLEDALADPSYEPWRALAEGFGFGSLVSVPMLFRNRAVGVLNGYSRAPRTFEAHELAVMETLALQAALALRLTLLLDDQQATIAQLRQSNDQLEHQRSVLERAHDIHLKLTDAVMAGADFAAVAQVLAQLLGRPTSITDPLGAVVATSQPPPDPHLPATQMMVSTIRVGAEVVGHVAVADVDSHSHDLDRRAIEHGATVLAVHVAKERVARATEQRLHSDFINDLLHGHLDEARLRDRASHYGLTLTDDHRVLVLVVVEPSGEDSDRRRDRALTVAASVLRERLPGAVFSQLGDMLTAIVATGSLPTPLEACRGAADEARRRVEQSARGVAVVVGIGNAARDPLGCRTSHDEALRCIQVMRRMGRGATLAIDDLGVLGLFLNTDRPDHLVALGHQVLGPALRHDAKGDGSLVRTLAAYLDNGCNLQTAADVLCVHQNTVKYRLRKIETLCDVDLRSPEDLLRATVARLSLKLLDVP